MSGLIWAGLGKGIADAGATFGSYMLKDIEDQRRRDDEERREANAIKRAEEADRIRAEREEKKAEALKQRITTETAQAQQRATEIGKEREGRRSAQLQSDAAAASAKLGELASMAGEPVNTFGKEQVLEQIRKDPALRESFRKQGLITGAAEPTRDARLERADDLLQAAREMGAHSSVLEGYLKDRRDTLDEIRRENEKREGDQRYQATMAAITERGRQFDEKKPIEQQRADAATTRANRPTGGKGGATTLRDAPVERLTTQAETLRKAAKEATGDRKKNLETELDQVLAELRRRRESPGAAPAPAPEPRPASPTKNYSNLWK